MSWENSGETSRRNKKNRIFQGLERSSIETCFDSLVLLIESPTGSLFSWVCPFNLRSLNNRHWRILMMVRPVWLGCGRRRLLCKWLYWPVDNFLSWPSTRGQGEEAADIYLWWLCNLPIRLIYLLRINHPPTGEEKSFISLFGKQRLILQESTYYYIHERRAVLLWWWLGCYQNWRCRSWTCWWWNREQVNICLLKNFRWLNEWNRWRVSLVVNWNGKTCSSSCYCPKLLSISVLAKV